MIMIVQVSEVDAKGRVLFSFTDFKLSHHLSSDSEDHVLVADCGQRRILLLNSELQLQRVICLLYTSPSPRD